MTKTSIVLFSKKYLAHAVNHRIKEILPEKHNVVHSAYINCKGLSDISLPEVLNFLYPATAYQCSMDDKSLESRCGRHSN